MTGSKLKSSCERGYVDLVCGSVQPPPPVKWADVQDTFTMDNTGITQ